MTNIRRSEQSFRFWLFLTKIGSMCKFFFSGLIIFYYVCKIQQRIFSTLKWIFSIFNKNFYNKIKKSFNLVGVCYNFILTVAIYCDVNYDKLKP